ncbi:MAG: hypothetical protein IT211_03500 [Armatimonadetes bacterium]|nr:hypothetical protein [Armatimonadota bacterium]
MKSELECIELYMSLEQLRFGERLEYGIEVSEEIDEEEVQVPPMILQPYVENAIWHGLLPRESGGSVTIAVERRGDDAIVLTVADNGIGRAQANQRKQSASENERHHSSGMRMIEERLELLQQTTGQHCSVQILDCYAPPDNTPTGTRVEIVIPTTLELLPEGEG